jgi:spore maturation protein CgeB
LHVAVVGPVVGGSRSIAESSARALRRLGHRVTFVDNRGYAPALAAIQAAPVDEAARASARTDLFMAAAAATRRAVVEARPQLALYLAQAPVLRDADLDDLRAAGIPSLFWFVEDFRVFTYWEKAVRRFDHVWTIQRGELERRLASAGHPSFDYVPVGCDPELHRRYPSDETHAFAARLAFAGSGYPNRRRLLIELRDLGLRLWGTHWDREPALAASMAHAADRDSREAGISGASRDGELPHATLARIFAATDVNLNLSSSIDPATFAIAKDLVNPRTFEISGCGGFQLADALIPVEEFFEPEREIVLFGGVEEARDKIRYYLAHEAKRRAIAARAHRRAHAEHTYDRRLAAALDRLAARDPRVGRAGSARG